MNKEEKEAIEKLDYFEPDDLIECAMYRDCVETIKNLIDKQQKEIEKIKEENKKYQGIEEGTTIIYKSKAKYVREDRIEKYYVNKNKIREKIKELRKKEDEISKLDYELEPEKAIDCILMRIAVLQELLGGQR